MPDLIPACVHLQWSFVVGVIHLRLTIIKGLGPSTTEGVPSNGPHRVGNEAIINGTGGILNILRSIGENSKLEGLQHHRLIRVLHRIMTVLMFINAAEASQRFLRCVTALF